MTSKRIEYIDLMKGICIILVVMVHCDITFPYPFNETQRYLGIFRNPLYFFLTGLFFKTYGGFKYLVIKKINNILIPYFFFSTLMIVPYILFPSFNKDIGNIRTLIGIYLYPDNFPLWFLRCLFISYIGYYILNKLVPNLKYRILVSFLISILVWFLPIHSKEYSNLLWYKVVWGLNFGTALFILPFIAVAEFFKSQGILVRKYKTKNKCIMLSIFILLWYICFTDNFNLLTEDFSDNIVLFYVSSFSGIFSILILSNLLKHLPYVSYIGRYSLIVLGTHAVLISILYRVTSIKWLVFVVVLLLSPLVVYFIKRCFPYFCAQKTVISYNKEGKLCFLSKK